MLEKIRKKVRNLKAQLPILMIAYKDKRTPFMAKLIMGIAIGYMLSPIDLIPDFIPVIGLLDDLIIVPLLITISFNLIPKEVIEEAKLAFEKNPIMTRKANWIFASIIIAIWATILIYLFLLLRNSNRDSIS